MYVLLAVLHCYCYTFLIDERTVLQQVNELYSHIDRVRLYQH
jgi:hypothetical protein